ncbi:MAG TPA: hypothetical protein ENN79_08660 [Desulfobacteraceae bacterium]|nr:hypothetical protein [Desulfobacteraceae bacterium]
MHIFVDQISQIVFSNNNIRITLTQRGPNESLVDVGTLIIPVNQANSFVNRLANGLTQLNEQMKAQTETETTENK